MGLINLNFLLVDLLTRCFVPFLKKKIKSTSNDFKYVQILQTSDVFHKFVKIYKKLRHKTIRLDMCKFEDEMASSTCLFYNLFMYHMQK